MPAYTLRGAAQQLGGPGAPEPPAERGTDLGAPQGAQRVERTEVVGPLLRRTNHGFCLFGGSVLCLSCVLEVAESGCGDRKGT